MSNDQSVTVRIPVPLHQKAKLHAVIERKTVQQVIAEVLAKWVEELEEAERRRRVA